MTDKPQNNELPIVPEDVLVQKLGDEFVVANLDTGVYFTLDELAARIWELLKDTESKDTLVTTLLSEYDVEEVRLRSDIDALFLQFQELGLIQPNHA